MRWRCAAALLALPWGLPAFALEPACRVAIEVAPATVWAGEQVQHRVTILRRADVSAVVWIEPPTFPGFRAEALRAENSGPDWIDRKGTRYLRFVERRALFPLRAGELELPSARLSCRAHATQFDPTQDQMLHTQSVTVLARKLPTDDRPPDFHGLVGPIALSRTLDSERVHLGDSVQLRIRLKGRGNLWDARFPAPGAPGFDVFPRAPKIEMRSGSSLEIDRSVRFDLVPRSVGTLSVEAFSLAYFDPASGDYARASVPALDVAVLPARQNTASPTNEDESSPQKQVPLRYTAFALALALGVFWLAARYRMGASRQDPLLPLEHAIRRWETDRDLPAAREIAHTLRSVLEHRKDVPDSARQLTRALERILYGAGAPGLEDEALRRVLRELRERES